MTDHPDHDHRRVTGLRRSVTDDEIAAFARDGVVCLRGILDPGIVAAMAPAVDALVGTAELADLTAMGEGLAAAGEPVLVDDHATTDEPGDGGRDDPGARGATGAAGATASAGATAVGRFTSGVDHWRHHHTFADFACRGPLPAIVATLLGSRRVQLWEDSVLIKEPGAREATAWHTDLSYFPVAGDQLCTTWVPLDPATAATGAVRFVVGSHHWPADFRPNLFVSTMAIPGTEGDEVPDVEALVAAGDVEVVCFDTEPGDLTVHHARTLHAAGPNRSATTRRRAISVRYCGDDARFHRRPGVMIKPEHGALADGAPLDETACPVVWPPA